MGAHPHVCGEHKVAFANNEQVQGSSPRMRGTHVLSRAADDLHGLIPTYAGNTGHYTVRGGVHGAHPHVCGEHTGEVRLSFAHLGSSPRMRGTLIIRQKRPILGGGLIPTYAGNTCMRESHPRTSRAHPHVCGEHPQPSPGRGLGGGSSPRMRGTQKFLTQNPAGRGLIPTYAGNTGQRIEWFSFTWAHPHVCGEHGGVHVHHKRFMGSSPRMRGTQKRNKGGGRNRGLIPTYAGNTAVAVGWWRVGRAHPHVCGEHIIQSHAGLT